MDYIIIQLMDYVIITCMYFYYYGWYFQYMMYYIDMDDIIIWCVCMKGLLL
jgi:hypothetical protein